MDHPSQTASRQQFLTMNPEAESVRLVQYLNHDGERRVAIPGGSRLNIVEGAARIYDLALEAIRRRVPLAAIAVERVGDLEDDYDAATAEGRLLLPLDHPDPAHCLVSGTGLTHLGSASSRDAMHAKLEAGDLSDSMKMFQWGLEGGKPAPDCIGVQPEWFYKGDGSIAIAPGHPLWRPAFAEDASEEAELVGLYLIGEDGTPWRLGYALGNELSDHVMENRNYLYLAHSKLRTCSFGPELRTGPLPEDVRGCVRIRRGEHIVWEREVLTGEANMSHSLDNLEHHHFKYPAFRRSGDVHVHFFGTSILSYADQVDIRDGDVFEVALPSFGRSLCNPIAFDSEPDRLWKVVSL